MMKSDSNDSESKCVHHWKIDEANGPVSIGKCQKCPAIKEFKNSFEEFSWIDWSDLQNVPVEKNFFI